MTRYDRTRRGVYDDPAFFDRYQQMRQRGTGLNEDLEQPALTRLLTAVVSRDVLDIGCSDGALAAGSPAAAPAMSSASISPSVSSRWPPATRLILTGIDKPYPRAERHD